MCSHSPTFLEPPISNQATGTHSAMELRGRWLRSSHNNPNIPMTHTKAAISEAIQFP
jgi:hypothetical protein